jgi:hypothetical protein
MKTCIAAALLLVCGICFAQAHQGAKLRNSVPYPTESQLRTAIGNAEKRLRAEGLDLEMFDAQKVGLTRPLLAARLSRDGAACLVFYNTKPENGLTQFFATIAASDLPVLLDAIAMHEATHCIEQREAYVRNRFDKVLPPGSGSDSATVQGYIRAVESGALETWGEALADIVSLLYLKQVMPDRWKELAMGIAGMRRNLTGKWPEHDTSPWLYKIIAADADAMVNHNLFETAFRLRQKYRPAR